MAKTYQLETNTYTQAQFDEFAHSILFADSIVPHWNGTAGNPDAISLIVTSSVESTLTGSASSQYLVLADDSKSEVAVDIATGKFVEGNVITGIAPLSEIQADVRDFVCYNIAGVDSKMFVGVCNSTQSQDYTPDLVANSRVIKMLTPQQVRTLNL